MEEIKWAAEKRSRVSAAELIKTNLLRYPWQVIYLQSSILCKYGPFLSKKFWLKVVNSNSTHQIDIKDFGCHFYTRKESQVFGWSVAILMSVLVLRVKNQVIWTPTHQSCVMSCDSRLTYVCSGNFFHALWILL